MDSAFLTCPICYEQFDLIRNLPKILPICGHTICSECLNKLLQNQNENQRRCPIDKLPFTGEVTNIDGFKANFLAKDILEIRSQTELCPEHNEELNVFCLTDQKKICGTCGFEGVHQNHKIRTMKAIKSEANSLARKVKGTLDNMDICYSKVSQTIKETKALLLERVKNEFQVMKKAIAEKEQDIVYQIQSYFYNQDQKLKNMVGNASNAWKSLHSEVSNLEKILKNEDLFKYEELFQKMSDHLANCKKEIDFQLIEGENEMIRSKIEQLLQSFHKFLQDSQVCSKLKLDLKRNLFNNLALGILKDFPAQPSNSKDEMETEEDPFIFKVETSFNFQYDGEDLTISTTELRKENTIDIEKWKKANNAILFLFHRITEEDMEILAFILRNLKADGLLYLEFRSNGFSPKILELWAQTSLPFSKVEIWLDKLDLTIEPNSILLGRMLSQYHNLEDIKLILEESKLSKKALNEILGDVLTNRMSIKSICLDLSKTNIIDDDICQFSLNLPNIKFFELLLKDTNVTNRIIEWLRTNLFTSMSCLESFVLYLNGTQITDAHMEDIFSAFKKIKCLTLDLGRTKITNKTLEALSRAMPSFVNGLDSLGVGLSGNNVTDEGVSHIFMSLPNVTNLSFILSRAKITDKTLELLAQKVLPSAIKLNSLSLILSNLPVSDNSMRQIFEALPELAELELGLNSTNVTDVSIAPFLIEKVQRTKGFRRFIMAISETNVSSTVQEKVRELENAINSGNITL